MQCEGLSFNFCCTSVYEPPCGRLDAVLLLLNLFTVCLSLVFILFVYKDDQRRASLRLKLEMAEFLQDTIEEISIKSTRHSQEKLKQFSNFVNKVCFGHGSFSVTFYVVH